MYPVDEYIGPDQTTEELWAVLFNDHQIFDLARTKSIYFTILNAGDGYHALVVTNRGRTRLSQRYWDFFKRSIKGSCRIDEAKGEIEFTERKIILNICNLLHTTAYHNVVIAADPDRLVSQYYKSGTMLTWSVGLSTYGESASEYNETARDLTFKGSIEQHVGFELGFLVARQIREINIFPSLTCTWPS